MPFTPHDAALHALQRAENLLAAAGTQGVPGPVADDMRRSSVVLAISALDTYMHRLVVDRSSIWDSLPAKLASTHIRYDQLVEEAHATYEAARKGQHNPRPGVRVKRFLRDQLLARTFQSPREIDEALRMTGATEFWGPIGTTLGLSKKQIEARLNPIVMRRNQIVHEGDYWRMQKPQVARLNTLTTTEARGHISFLRDLVNAIHAAV